MTDQLVSFPVAKLAKQKGFKPEREWNPEYVSMWYDDDDFPDDEPILTEMKEEDYSCECHYLAPTQTKLQKWLREQHKLNVSPKYHDGKWIPYVQLMYEDRIKGYWGHRVDEYEIAMNDGLLSALKLIKDEES